MNRTTIKETRVRNTRRLQRVKKAEVSKKQALLKEAEAFLERLATEAFPLLVGEKINTALDELCKVGNSMGIDYTKGTAMIIKTTAASLEKFKKQVAEGNKVIAKAKKEVAKAQRRAK